MLRIFTAILLLLLHLDAKAPKKDKFILYAKKITSTNSVIEAEGDVLLYSKKYTFRANRALYHKATKSIDLFGDVYISDDQGNITHLNKTSVNLNRYSFNTKNLFIFNRESDIWFHSDNVSSSKDRYILKGSALSSCDRLDPDWMIGFTKGVYNKKEEFVLLKNPTFYIKNRAVLYLPWFAFPTAKERKSGFLKPIFGFESRENIFFVMPYFIASHENWDLELDPQIRLNRGQGLYATLRFMDSRRSGGVLNVGFFNDKKRYKRKHNLKNITHYGLNFQYFNAYLLDKKGTFLEKDSFKDGLLADITYLNDIDYINLNHKNRGATSKLATSKINYVLFNDNHFFGLYNKYFIDTEKSSNSDTLQTLPSLEYHYFSHRFKIPNILYSFDYKFKNNYRKSGLNARQQEFLLPITFSKALFGEYLNFQISENLYYSKVNYSNETVTKDYADYFSNYHKFELSSDLTKRFDTFIHNIQLYSSFVVPSKEKRSGYFADFIPFNLETKNLSLKLNEYFYHFDGFNFLTHRMVQLFYDDERFYKYGDLENQIIYYPTKDIKLDNTIFYSHKFHRVKKLQSSLDYRTKRYYFTINHTYEYKENDKDTNFLASSFGAKIDRVYDIFGSLDYNLEDKFTKEWTVGWRMQKKCWEYMFRYKESVTPNLTSKGAESLIKRGVLLSVSFHPFGGVKYEYNRESILTSTEELRDE